MEQNEDAACPPLTQWFLTCFVGRYEMKGAYGVKEAACYKTNVPSSWNQQLD